MTEETRCLSRRAVMGAGAALATAATIGATNPARAATLEGKSALITGCSSGFGRLTALHLAREGATVIASMRNLDSGARPEAVELAEIAAEEDLDLSIVEIDVTDEALIAAGVAEAEEIAGGGLDLMVNNAGIAITGPIEIHDHEAAFKQMDVNLFGCHRMARAVLPAMRARQQGLIIQVTSQLGRFVSPITGMYCSTKFAAEAMFEAMAYELAPTGVEVTIVQPGGYPTKITENGARYTREMLSRVDAARLVGYEPHMEIVQTRLNRTGAGARTDPMDVARAIGEILAMPNGSRPLRRPVHPNTQATDAINERSAEVQAAVLGRGPYAAWHEAVTS